MMEDHEEHLVKPERAGAGLAGWGRGLVTLKRGLLADGAPDGRTILRAGKIETFLRLPSLNFHSAPGLP